ncbi:glycosyltransferase family 4 protein [Pseudoalteromonas distincta]|uniref:Glycosyltransferase n=1 Tax=Pseudoalteromonas distincta TaxID=77608 RepID=A0A4P9IXP7_9GAMM|nr:glycosyltransferase family 4 protein [Pseudoalteromonas distincta]QCU73137.1 glycosyltransferase [Pseudoalteromonas distincta]
MKILILNTLYYPYKVGGAEVSVQFLAEGLAEIGHDVYVACIVPKGSVHANTSTTINGVNVLYVPLLNLYWPFNDKARGKLIKLMWHILDSFNPLMIRQVKKLVKAIKPDVIHTNNLAGFSAGVLSCLTKSKVKVLHTARDYYFLHPNCTLMDGKEQLSKDCLSVKFWSAIRGRFLKNVDTFISISYFVKELYCTRFDFLSSKSEVVYNPVQVVDGLNNVKSNRGELVFGFIGRLSPEKGFDDFVKLADFFSSANSNAKFIVAGKGESKYVNSILSLYHRANIELLGFVEPSTFYERIDVLVSPTKWPEPFGRTIIEARSFGVRVIAYPSGGIREIFYLLNESEFLVEDFDTLKVLALSLSFNSLDKEIKMHEGFLIKEHCSQVEELYNA